MPCCNTDIVTAFSSSTTATNATLRIKTKAGTEETVEMPMPPTHICQYVPAPGEAVGYKITVRADVFGTRADMWLRNVIDRSEWAEPVDPSQRDQALIRRAAEVVQAPGVGEYLTVVEKGDIATLLYVVQYLHPLVPETAPFKAIFHLQEALWRVVEVPWVSPLEVKNPNEVTPFPRDGRRLYLVNRGDLGDRRNAILQTMVPLSEIAEPWRPMADSALQGLVGEAVEKLMADKALVLPGGKGREDVVVTIKHDKTRVPLRPIESWCVKSPTTRIGKYVLVAMETDRPLVLPLTSVPPTPPSSNLPRVEWIFHMEFRLLYPGLHWALEEDHVFPRKGVAAADASLIVALQRALDDIMVATSINHTQGRMRALRRGPKVKLSGQCTGGSRHLRQAGKKKSKHYWPTSCPSAMKISVVRTTAAAPNKDPAIARLAETEAKSLKVVISRLHNHSCIDQEFRRHVEPRVLEKLQGLAGKKASPGGDGGVTTGAPQPAARGGSRRKSATCASEGSRGPPKPNKRKRNLSNNLPLAPASAIPASVGGRDDAAPQEMAAEEVSGGHPEHQREPFQIASQRIKERGRLARRMIMVGPLRQLKVARSFEQLNHQVGGGTGGQRRDCLDLKRSMTRVM